MAVPNYRNFKNKILPLRVGTVKTQKKPLPSVIKCRGGSETAPLRFCASCPFIVPLSRTTFSDAPIICGPTRSILHDSLLTHRTGSVPCLLPCNNFHTSQYAADKSCPPPCKGSPGCCPSCCGSLPPPCNTPPKCIQYMTGYYYYPYGFWFCGPYHVSGICTPCGPCTAGGPPCGPPCGPTCGPPCGPCPPAKSPCPKCCLCPKCCACMNPVSAAVVGSDTEPRCQSVQTPPPARPHQQAINYPLPHEETAKHESCPQPRIKGGIAKFFPFTSIPALVPPRHMPQSSVNVCPYSTQHQTCPQCPSTFRIQDNVYCTPCIKPSFSTRLRHPFSNNEKRTERTIHHKRSKKVNCALCPILESPRGLLTQEQRDRPATFPGAFQYTNIPNYRKPYPPQPPKVAEYKEYEN